MFHRVLVAVMKGGQRRKEESTCRHGAQHQWTYIRCCYLSLLVHLPHTVQVLVVIEQVIGDRVHQSINLRVATSTETSSPAYGAAQLRLNLQI